MPEFVDGSQHFPRRGAWWRLPESSMLDASAGRTTAVALLVLAGADVDLIVEHVDWARRGRRRGPGLGDTHPEMSDDPGMDEQLATLQHMVLLAAIDMIRAEMTDESADVAELVGQILETADSPEHAVDVCIAVFAGSIKSVMAQLGQDPADLLQGTLLSDLESDD